MSDHDPVFVTAVRLVPAERELEFTGIVQDFLSDATRQPGCEGMQVMRRVVGDQLEFTIFAKFTDKTARSAFISRPAYDAWLRRLDLHVSAPSTIVELSGLQPWFMLPDQPGIVGPPAWKMAVTTWIAVSAVTSVVPPLLTPLFSGLHPLIANLFINLPVVVLLTWVVMPFATSLLHRWLFAPNVMSKQTDFARRSS
jgi:antibiotic biosynthesis monooxygenase (ABM) superfamily enzyme